MADYVLDRQLVPHCSSERPEHGRKNHKHTQSIEKAHVVNKTLANNKQAYADYYNISLLFDFCENMNNQIKVQ